MQVGRIAGAAAFVLLGATLLASCAGSFARDQPARAASASAYDFAGVTGYLDAGYQSLGLPGAGLVVWQDGQVVYEKTFGAYTPETQVPIASASKWLSAAVILTLVDEGKLSLEDTPGRLLPGFSGDMATMTLRQMFSHSSGLVDFPGAWDYAITMQDYAARVARDGVMRAKPGTEVRYASASMQVAGAMAEKASGQLWNDLFLERIARPCGMLNTTFARQPTNRNPMLAGGAWSTLADYSRFMEMIARGGICNGRRVLSERSVREMQADQTKDLPLVAASNDRMGRASHYGLGEWLDVQGPDGRTIQVSSPGAFGFRPWLNLDRNLYGVFLMRREADAPGANETFNPWVLIDRVHAAADRARPPLGR
jgi:CubicO group peptidase (beta-lactamase class C family)